MIRVFIADDHELMRKGVRALLDSQPNIEVCGEANNGRDAFEQVIELKPDVAVLDISMPEMSGLEATRQIRQIAPETEVLIFTVHESDTLVRDVLSAGAHGYILKADASAHLVAAIEALAQNDLYLSKGVSEQLVKSFAGDRDGHPEKFIPISELSPREVEITRLLAEGKSNKEIAARLFISVRTVETHRRAIFAKLDIHSIAELVRYAIRTGLISA